MLGCLLVRKGAGGRDGGGRAVMSDPHEAVADADAVGGIIVVGGTGGVDG